MDLLHAVTVPVLPRLSPRLSFLYVCFHFCPQLLCVLRIAEEIRWIQKALHRYSYFFFWLLVIMGTFYRAPKIQMQPRGDNKPLCMLSEASHSPLLSECISPFCQSAATLTSPLAPLASLQSPKCVFDSHLTPLSETVTTLLCIISRRSLPSRKVIKKMFRFLFS